MMIQQRGFWGRQQDANPCRRPWVAGRKPWPWVGMAMVLAFSGCDVPAELPRDVLSMQTELRSCDSLSQTERPVWTDEAAVQCCVDCVRAVKTIAERGNAFWDTVERVRGTVAAIVLAIALVVMMFLNQWFDRRRWFLSRPLLCYAIIFVVVPGILAAMGLWTESQFLIQDATKLRGADQELRDIKRIGFRDGQGRGVGLVSCPEVVKTYGAKDRCGKTLDDYSGLLTPFEPGVTAGAGSKAVDAWRKERAEDVAAFLAKGSLEPSLQPKSTGEIYAGNEALRTAAEVRLGYLAPEWMWPAAVWGAAALLMALLKLLLTIGRAKQVLLHAKQ